MTKAPLTALLGAGSVSQTWVGRLPGLRQNLTLVLSSSLRVASRISNQLRAGRPIESMNALAKAELIFIGVPEDQITGTITTLLVEAQRWQNCSFVLCSRQGDSVALEGLRERGASVGSLSVLDGFDERRYVFEGDKVAFHRTKRLIELEGTARVLEMESGMRRVFEAGLTFAGGMTFPMISAAVEAMKAAGLQGKQAEGIVEAAVVNSLRSYLKSGKRGWSGPIAKGDREELRRQYNALRESDEDLGEMFLKMALDYLVERASGEPKQVG